MTRLHLLERTQLVRRSRSEVFAFFAAATNLEALTPPALQFQILTPEPIAMHSGTLIDYRIRLFGLPMVWKTLIELFEPESRFIDRQLRGPYRSWRHTHAFESVPDGTLIRDRVEYVLPLGLVGDLASSRLVALTLDHIFEYRRQRVEELFPAGASARPG